MKTLAVVDYGIGNLGSVLKGLRHVGVSAVLTGDPRELDAAEALVLPGDGAFGATMEEIRRRGLEAPLRRAAAEGRPLLGICIGMQVLFDESEEHGHHQGLGLLPGRVRRIPGPLPVPHMGWNQLHPTRSHPLIEGVQDGDYVYFVHSYYCDAPEDVVLAWTDYGRPLPAVVGRGSVLGMQFHPEKSQGVGLGLVANFVRRFFGVSEPAGSSSAAGGRAL